MRPKRRQTALEEIDDSNIHSLTPYIHFRWRRVRRPGRAGPEPAGGASRRTAGGAQEEHAQRAAIGVAGEGQATGDRRVMLGAGSTLVEHGRMAGMASGARGRQHAGRALAELGGKAAEAVTTRQWPFLECICLSNCWRHKKISCFNHCTREAISICLSNFPLCCGGQP